MDLQVQSPTSEQLKYIERFGMIFESVGQAPMTGRILGWLLICNPPNQSMKDLTEVLQASKGSISTSLQVLTNLNFVEKMRIPGERRAYYRIPEGIWADMLEMRMMFISLFKQLAQDGLSLIEDAPESNKLRLNEMRDVFTFFESEFPIVIQHWKERQAKREKQ
jgi:DNA-binding transcriptional regulator GbsR (MarR family)